MSNAEQLENSIVITDEQTITIADSIIAPEEQPAVDIIGNNAQLIVTPTGVIAPDSDDDDDGNTAIQSLGDNVEILNAGSLFGDLHGIDSDGNGFSLTNERTITSNSRAVQLDDGDGLNLLNTGVILGISNQRNGTLYIDGTVDNATIDNRNLIDAGDGNTGDGFSSQIGAASEDAVNENINIFNSGTITGRGQAEFSPEEGRLTANGSSGVRFFNGEIVNNGVISGGNGFAIDANGAGGSVNVVNNAILESIVRLGNDNDLFTQNSSEVVRVKGGAGSDTLIGGIGNDILQGGGGSDTTDGGDGIDTADFSVDL